MEYKKVILIAQKSSLPHLQVVQRKNTGILKIGKVWQNYANQRMGLILIKSFDDAHDTFYKILKSISETRIFVKGLAPQMPSEVLTDLATHDQELDAIAKTIDDLRWHFCSNPSDKMMKGQQLNREEIYLLAARGMIVIPSITGKEAYEEFAYYYYEDEEQRGYINPAEFPDPPPVHAENDSYDTITTHFKLRY